jgi:hypothetical protein
MIRDIQCIARAQKLLAWLTKSGSSEKGFKKIQYSLKIYKVILKVKKSV